MSPGAGVAPWSSASFDCFLPVPGPPPAFGRNGNQGGGGGSSRAPTVAGLSPGFSAMLGLLFAALVGTGFAALSMRRVRTG